MVTTTPAKYRVIIVMWASQNCKLGDGLLLVLHYLILLYSFITFSIYDPNTGHMQGFPAGNLKPLKTCFQRHVHTVTTQQLNSKLMCTEICDITFC